MQSHLLKRERQDVQRLNCRDVDVALVTPLRDGMNLVAKEFVACRTDKPGVLILSSFAGAGEMMQEALSVNPYLISNLVGVLHQVIYSAGLDLVDGTASICKVV